MALWPEQPFDQRTAQPMGTGLVKANILLGLDNIHDLAHVLGFVQKIAQSLNAKVWLMHIREPDDQEAPGLGSPMAAVPDPDYLAEAEKQRREESLETWSQQLSESVQRLSAHRIEAEYAVEEGPVVDRLLAKAGELNPVMIVLESHHHGLLHDLFVGSVEKDLLARATCPVLVVPPPSESSG